MSRGGKNIALFALAAAALLPLGCKRGDAPETPAPQAAQPPASNAFDTLSGRIKIGESFNSIVRGLGLDEAESSLLLSSIKDNFRFKLFAGQVYQVIIRKASSAARPIDAALEVASFALEDKYSDNKHVLYRSEAASVGFRAISLYYKVEEIPVHVDTASVSGIVTSNLYEAFMARGETPALIQLVTKIF